MDDRDLTKANTEWPLPSCSWHDWTKKEVEDQGEPTANFNVDSSSEDESEPPTRGAEALERTRKIQESLLEWGNASAMIKGELYGKEATEARWNRRIAVSTDHRVVEMDSEGRAVDITNALIMANSTGFDAAEANEAVTFTCSLCNSSGLGHSKFI